MGRGFGGRRLGLGSGVEPGPGTGSGSGRGRGRAGRTVNSGSAERAEARAGAGGVAATGGERHAAFGDEAPAPALSRLAATIACVAAAPFQRDPAGLGLNSASPSARESESSPGEGEGGEGEGGEGG